MGRRTRLTASVALMVLALGTAPAGAAELWQTTEGKQGFLARLWQGLSELLPAVAKLGPELDPGGTPVPGQDTEAGEKPIEDGYAGMASWSAPDS